ncbi:MAG: rRNA pseudouridine synthase [Paludibacteraceae bacterium]|nr:rRNA pseudouridine synthase [Paludibacteraceae bacterium]
MKRTNNDGQHRPSFQSYLREGGYSSTREQGTSRRQPADRQRDRQTADKQSGGRGVERVSKRVAKASPQERATGRVQRNEGVYTQRKQQQYKQRFEDPTKPIRLNKYLANAGICSRREADDYIQAGVVKVNGVVVDNLGAKVMPTDRVLFHDQPVHREQKVYILLNKPKNTVTTTDDPQERMTVLDIVRNACPERVYPVGRLDRNTTGVLLLTNDGDLAVKLTHPKYGKKKIYAATLDKELTEEAERTLRQGVVLDGEKIVPDALEFPKDDRLHIGLEIHSGQNRVVRRMFEQVGCRVLQLDRVSFAGLTKKNVPRGKFRFLTPKEVAMLQMGAFE